MEGLEPARGSRLVDRGLVGALYLACALFAAVMALHVYLFHARPRAPDLLQEFTTAETLQVFSAPETIYLRAYEAQALDSGTVAASILLLVGALGYYRTRRRRRKG
jgi:hypothetical protein